MFKMIKDRFSKRKKLARNQPEILRYEELEQRVLFSADAVPGLDTAAVEEQVIVQDVASDVRTEREAASETVEQATEEARSELVLVNENVADYEQLIGDLQAGDYNRIIEVVVLESDRNGIEQVSEILAERSDLAAVHVISHGSDGQISLGDSWLTSTTLQQNIDAVAGWGNALTERGDILFYGCNIAADSDGQSLLDDIAELTGADVIASDDLTGSAARGGDWDLEYNTGKIETGIAVSAAAQANYDAVLATFTVNNTSDFGAGSLRQAILDANASGTPNTINFSISEPLVGGAHTIQLTSALPFIDRSVIIDGTTDPDYAGTPLIVIDGSLIGGGNDNGFMSDASNVTIKGFVIQNFSGAGIHFTGAGDHTIESNYIGTDITGTVAQGNGIGIYLGGGADDVTIGGAGVGNLISGNLNEGIQLVDVGSVTIKGNLIGTDATGTADLCNGTKGIDIQNSVGNLIGGSTTADRNVIAGNNDDGIILWGAGSTLNVIQGNYVGVDATGNTALGNLGDGIAVAGGANNNTIGGDRTAGEGNVLSGNSGTNSDGIEIDNAGADNNKIYGNYIGTNFDGTSEIPNARHGVVIYDGVQGTLIGGSGTGQGNIISKNTEYGIVIDGNNVAATSGNVIQANTIGLNAAGNALLGNGEGGIYIFGGAQNNTIGGSGAGEGNVISGNGGTTAGVYISGSTTSFNTIQGNLIGTDGTGSSDLGNAGRGVYLNGAASTTVDDNIISGNDSYGIHIIGATASGTSITGNNIGLNAAGTASVLNTDDAIYLSTAGTTTIGGTAVGDGNVINATFGKTGIDIWNTANTTIQGNLLGTDAAGTTRLSGGSFGINAFSAANTQIGSTAAGAGNVIAGYSVTGINFSMAASSGSAIQGNFIGTDTGGTIDLTTGIYGITLQNSATGILIGGSLTTSGNTIAYNSTNGVRLMSTAGDSNSILRNLIYGNGQIGIDLGGDDVTLNDLDGTDDDTGANNLQNFPVITQADLNGTDLTVSGSLNTDGLNTQYRIEFYGNAVGTQDPTHGEGRYYLGTTTVTTDGSGDGAFSGVILNGVTLSVGDYVTATATRIDEPAQVGLDDELAYGSTSEFAANVAITSSNAAPVITSNGGGSAAFINVAENTTAVTTVMATDADGETPTYTLVSGADQALFDIDTNTGVLTFKTAPDFENPTDANLDGTYEVVVLASDGVGGTDTQMIFVTLTNINEGADQNVSINENTIMVANVWAGDSDAPPYGIVGGADASLFQVSHDPIGKRFYLMFSALPNFESPADSDGDNVYEVTVNFNDVHYSYFVTVQDANDAPVGLPTISGTLTEDQTLTVDASGISDEDGLGSFSYQWLRNGSAISGATANTYTLGDADVGAQISVEVSYTDGFGANETVTSAQTAAVANINDAPVFDNSGFLTLTTITEDNTSNNGNLISEILASDGALPNPVTDVDTAALEGIAINSLNSSNGTWEYNIGSGWDPVGTVTWNSSLLLRATDRLRFVPDGVNADFATVSFTAWDQTSGTAGTKVDTFTYDPIGAFSFNVEVASINVTAVNDLPVFDLDADDSSGGATGNHLASFAEGDAPVAVIDNDVSINDVDNSTMSGVGMIGSFNGSVDGSEEIYAMGGQQFVMGTAKTVVVTQGSTDFELDFDGSSLQFQVDSGTGVIADMEALLATMTYEHTGEDPTAGVRTFSFIVTDANGGNSNVVVSSINVTAVNDAPTVDLNGSDGAGTNFTATFTEDGGAINVTDTDAIISDVDDTSFQYLGINLFNMPDGTSEQIVVAGYTFAYGSGDVVTRTVGSTDFEIDFDATGFSIVKFGGGIIPIADLQTLMRGITYENISQNPTSGDRVIEFETQDASGLVGPVATSTITVNAQNDAPVVTTTGGSTAYTEQAAATVIDAGITLTDPDGFDGTDPSDQFVGIVRITGNYEAADILGFTDTTNIQGVLAGDTLSLSVIGGQTATVADFQAALRSVTFYSGSDTPSELNRTITFSFDDGVDSSNLSTKTVQVTAVNDAPEGANKTVTTSEDTDYVFDTVDFGFTDLNDSPADNFANVIITTTVTNGTLYVDSDGNGLVDGGEALSDLDTVSVADITAGRLKFKPAANAHGTNLDSFTFQVQDDGGGSDTDLTINTMTIDVTAVNDAAPVANDDTYSVSEDNTLTADWWNTAWTRRQELTLDNAAQAETLTDFPVLIILNDSNIDYAQTKDDGSDLRFFAADGTQLVHEIEQWNEGGDSSVWVRVPQITGNSNSDSIWMYYGNAAAQPVTNAVNVWDNYFVGVWHLNQEQSGTGNVGVYKDSTGTGNNGIDRIAATGQDGQVTDGQEFGTSDWVEIAHDTSLDLKDSMTISFWIKPNSDSGTFNRVVEKGLWGYQDSYYFGGGNGTNDLTFYLNDQEVFDTADNVLTVGEWQHCTVSYTSNGDGTGSARLYINGVEVDSNGDPAGVAAPPIGTYNGGIVAGNTGRLAIGHENSSYDFDAFIDEVQISNTDRSADWIAAQYQATKNQFGVEFVKFGGEESAPAVGGVLGNDSDVDNDPLSITLVDGPDNAQSFTLNKDGTFTYTPTANYHGSDTFTYEVSDGNGGTAQATATITVNPINDDPTNTGALPTDVIVTEDVTSSVDLSAVNFSDVDAGNNLITVTLKTSTGGNIWASSDFDVTVFGSGTETLTLIGGVADLNNFFSSASRFQYLHGTAHTAGDNADTIQVEVNDGGNTGSGGGSTIILGTVNVDITPVNDTPTTVGIADITVDEDAADSVVDLFAAFADVEDLDPALTYTITNNTNPGLFTSTTIDGVAGSLTLNYAADQNGSSDLSVRATDTGGQFVETTFTVTVNPVNDTPTTVGIADITVDEDAADSVVDLFAAFADVEDLDPALTYSITNNTNPGLFTATTIDGVAGSLTLDYAADQNGAADITVRATDTGGQFVETTFTVTVNAVNDTPTTSGIADITVDEDAADSVVDLFAAFADVEDLDSALTYTITGNTNPGLFTATTIDGVAGSLTLDYAADQNGSSDITVRATDTGGQFVETTFTVTVNPVNDTPTTVGIADVTVDEDAADSVVDLFAAFADVEDLDSALTYTVTNNTNPGLFTATTIDGVAGSLTLNYAANQNGAADITVRATDTGGQFVETTFTVTVNAVNDTPTTSGIADVTVDEDATDSVVDLFAAFADIEDLDPALTYTITNNTNPGLFTSTTIDGVAGSLTLDYAADQNGAADITVRATDTGGQFVETTFTVTVNPVNDTPTTSGIADVTVDEDATDSVVDLFAAFADIEDLDPALTYSITNNTNPGLFTSTTVDGVAGSLTLDYAADQNGSSDITVRATDTGGQFVETTFTVTVNPVNDTPTTVGIADVTVDEDAADSVVDLFAAFADVEDLDSALTYTITNNTNPALFTSTAIDGVAGSLTLNYAAAQNGAADITIRATDTGGQFVETTFTVTVNPINDTPTTVGIADITVDEDAADSVVDLFAAFADVEDLDPALTYTITNNTNPGLFTSTAIDGVAGSLTLNYAAAQNGAADITIRATDTGGQFVETTFTVTVNPINDTPTTVGIADVTVDEDAADSVVDLFAAFADVEDLDPDLTYTITGNTNPGLFNSTTIDGVAGSLTLDYAADQNGAADITVRATDTGGQFVETTFTVTVNPVNDTPTTVGIADITVAEDAADSVVDLFAAFADVEDLDPALTYTITGNTNPGLFTATTIDGVAGSLTINYAADQNGSADITVRATDTGGKFVETTFTVTVNAVNDTPTTSGIADITVDEDAADSVVDLFAAFADVEDLDSALTYTVTNNTNPGLFTATTIDGVAGSLTLNYAANQNGAADITVRATDTGGQFVETTFTVTVNAVNDTPTTSGIADITVDEDATDSVVDLFAAFADIEDLDPALTYTITNNTNPGLFTSTTIDGVAGSLTLDYAADQNGAADITVRATDTGGQFVETTFTVTVNPVNDTPTTSGIADVTVDEDATDSVVDLFAAFADIEDLDPALTYSITNNTNPGLFTSTTVDGVAGSLTLDYAADQNGSSDITVRATDTGGQFVETTFTVTVNPVNDTPTTVGIADVTVDEDAADSVVDLFAAFADVEDLDSALTYTITNNTNPALFTSTAIDGVAGSLTLNYAAAQNGAADITIRATDTGGQFVETTFTVTVNPINDTPTTVGIADVTVDEDAADSVVDLFAAFADVEDLDSALTYTITNNTNPGLFTATTIDGVAGSLTLNYAADQNGAAAITVRATDTGGQFVETTFTVTVNPVNDTPTTVGIADITVAEDAADSVVDLFAAFADVEDLDPALTYTITGNTNPGLFTATTIDGVAGSLTLNYAADQNGSADITIRATDTGGQFVETTFTVTVNAVNDTPTTTGIADITVDEDAVDSVVDLFAAFADVEDLDPDLTYTITGNTNPGLFTSTTIDGVAGSLTLDYAADQNGAADITIRATDTGGQFVETTFTVTVNAVNDTPTTVGIADVTVDEDVADSVVDLFAAFADVEDLDPALTYSITNNTNPGLFTSTTIDGVAGSLTLDYAADQNGAADITVRATDTGGKFVETTFTVTVNPVNDAPTTTPVTLTAISEDSGTRLITQAELLANATDVDGPALTATNLTINAGSGTLIDNGDGTWAYTPAADDDTSVSFTYTVTDGSLTAAGSATLDITPVNDAPVTHNDSATVDEDQNVVINLVGNDADVENALDLSAITITAAPTNGSLVDNGDGTLTYTHDGSKTTSDRFSYTINDVSGATSNIASVSLTVNPANDNDTTDSTDPDPILLEDPVTDEDDDSNIGDPTYEAPVDDPFTVDEVVSPVEAIQTPEVSGDADESIVQIKDPQDEETQEIIYLTDEIDRNTQTEGREDDRGYTYYDNDLYKDISLSNYLNLNGLAAENESVVVSLDDISILDFDGDDSDPVVANDDYDSLRQEIDESFNTELKGQAIKAKIVTVTAATFTVGIVSYLLRAGSLVASMMSALPLWRGFDPIAIFSGDKKKKKKQDEISDTGELKPEAFFDGDAE